MTGEPRRPSTAGKRSRRKGSSRPPQADTPAEQVLQLTTELAGLHRAQRSRTVIEQAKGVLMARLACRADQAFEHLSQLSQQTNTKVADAAAHLLGLTTPPTAVAISAGSAASGETLADQDAARYHLACAAMSAAPDGDAVATALFTDGLQPLGATGVALALRDDDDVLRLVGSHGLSRGVVSAWHRVPTGLPVGYLRAAAEGRSLWLSRDEAAGAGLTLLSGSAFRACLPLRQGPLVAGVAVVLWDDQPDLEPRRRALVSALAAAAGRRLLQSCPNSGTVAASEAHWLEAILEALPGCFALLCPIRDDSGTVVDWRVDKASPHARDPAGRSEEHLTGRRLLELYPHLAGGEVLRGLAGVLRTGQPFTHDPASSGTTTVRTRAARLGGGILISWQPAHPDGAQEHINMIEELTGGRWLEWDLQTSTTTSSPGTCPLFGNSSPESLIDLPSCAAGQDRPALQAAVNTLLTDHRPADLTVCIGQPPTKVRIVLSPVLDRHDRLVAAVAPERETAIHPETTATPRRADRRPESSAADQELRETAQRLRAQVALARGHQQEQALVEQAKGMLTARLGCPLDAALNRLIRTARQQQLSLPQAAAAVVGTPAPDRPPGPGPAVVQNFRPGRYLVPAAPIACAADGERHPGSPSEQRFAAALAAAETGDAVASALWTDGLSRLGAHAVLLGVLEPDGAVRLAGTYGLPADLVRVWSRTPSSLNVAYLRAVATDQPLWITQRQATERGWQLLGEGELRACLPLHEDGNIFGVASVLWPRTAAFDNTARYQVATMVDMAGQRLSQLLRSGGTASPAVHWARTVMAALPASYVLLHPVRRNGDQIVDWRLAACSPGTVAPAGRGAPQLHGHRLQELNPQLAGSVAAEAYLKAWHTGDCVIVGPSDMEVPTPHGSVTVTVSGRAVRFGDGLLVHWRRHDDDRQALRLRLLEQATGAGWARWDLSGGPDLWSQHTYHLLRRDPQRGPIRLGAMHRLVVADEQDAVANAVHTLTRHGDPVDRVVTLRRQGRLIQLRFTACARTDNRGDLVEVRGVFRRYDSGHQPLGGPAWPGESYSL